MARIDPILRTAPVARIFGAHQSTVTTILRAVELGLFTAAEADVMIDRVRVHLTALPIVLPSPVADAGLAADNPARLARVTKDRTGHSDTSHQAQIQEMRP